MGFLFLLYVGFTLYLYFSRQTIRLEVNFVVRQWYEAITDLLSRLGENASSAYRQRQRRNRRY